MDGTMNDVTAAYNRIAGWFDQTRTRALIELPYLDYLTGALKEGASILDLGCGTGEPMLRYLVERQYEVLGVDASVAMIDIARARFPATRFEVCDMRELNLQRRFDAVIAWHSLFHLAPGDQRAMFQTFARHLQPGGLLMFTSGSEAGEVWSENGGEALYHASLSLAEYRSLLEAHGFEVVHHVVDDTACGGAIVWIARLGSGQRRQLRRSVSFSRADTRTGSLLPQR
jgi:ubiquinone/menaquinone biosynthesis C-methylase UbiE